MKESAERRRRGRRETQPLTRNAFDAGLSTAVYAAPEGLAVAVCDAAVLVCEPSPERVVALTPLLKYIEDHHVPHIIFVNKIDSAQVRVRDMLSALQGVSARKLVLRQVPIRRPTNDGGEETVGYVDLVSERAYRYKSSGASDLIEMPAEILPREADARREMLETLSEFDDTLLEQLIEDIAPEKSLIYRDLHDEFGSDQIVPVLLGAGDRENGVRRLLKALRHDTPFVAVTAQRRDLPSNGVAMAECFKVLHQSHAGKLSLCRVWSGTLSEGQNIGGQRIGTLLRPFGQRLDKVSEAKAGEIVALAKVDALSAGQSRRRPTSRPPTRRCSRSRSPPRTATTRSSCRAPCTRSSRRIRRSPSRRAARPTSS